MISNEECRGRGGETYENYFVASIKVFVCRMSSFRDTFNIKAICMLSVGWDSAKKVLLAPPIVDHLVLYQHEIGSKTLARRGGRKVPYHTTQSVGSRFMAVVCDSNRKANEGMMMLLLGANCFHQNPNIL